MKSLNVSCSFSLNVNMRDLNLCKYRDSTGCHGKFGISRSSTVKMRDCKLIVSCKNREHTGCHIVKVYNKQIYNGKDEEQ